MSRPARYLPRLLLITEIVLACWILHNVAYVTTYRLYISHGIDTASRSTAAQRFDIEGSRVVPQIVMRPMNRHHESDKSDVSDRVAFESTLGRPSTLHAGLRAEGREDPRWEHTPRYGRRLRARVDTVSEWRHGDIVRMGYIPPDVSDASLHRFRFQTDDEGFRNARTRARIDVAALGDSFTDAMTIDAHDSWTSILERQTGLAVQNYGTAGFGPQQEQLPGGSRPLRFRVPSASEDISGELNVPLPRWLARNVRQVCDRVVGLQITRDRAFRNGDSELQQLAVDPRSAPETILRGQAPNQISTR